MDIDVRAAATHTDTFQHDALLYAGLDDFVEQVGAFIHESAQANEPILVVVGAHKIERLRAALGAVGEDLVQFADMASVGVNPARIIPAWQDFVNAHPQGTRFRGVGEPIWAERTADELIECQRHEALLNLAFEGSGAWTLVCPYDTKALSPAVIDEAFRTHPAVIGGGARSSSSTYVGLPSIARPFDAPLPEPVGSVVHMGISSLEELREVRRFVVDFSTTSGLQPDQIEKMTLAVNEIATNSIRHAGGPGSIRAWISDHTVVFEVRDAGQITDPMIGRTHPAGTQESGFGSWLVNQLCDLVQIRTYPDGSVTRLHMRRA
jgi:anti-sigma regulatory factor (Ser/Thr protein kinase)